MPFKNKAQIRACFSQLRRDLSEGRKVRWDCYKWLEETHKKSKSKSKKRSNNSERRLC